MQYLQSYKVISRVLLGCNGSTFEDDLDTFSAAMLHVLFRATVVVV